jgi:hypothetical protein
MTLTHFKIDNTFANLRNSLHVNGVYRTSDLGLKIEFKFVKNSRVECTSWEHIVVLLKTNVDILEKMLLSAKIINIKTEIKDDFAFGA